MDNSAVPWIPQTENCKIESGSLTLGVSDKVLISMCPNQVQRKPDFLCVMFFTNHIQLFSHFHFLLSLPKTRKQQCLLKNIECFSSDIKTLSTIFGKCHVLWTEAKLQLLGLREREALGNKPLRESEKLFWMSPELVESLMPFLDPTSITMVANTHPPHQRGPVRRTQLATRASTHYAMVLVIGSRQSQSNNRRRPSSDTSWLCKNLVAWTSCCSYWCLYQKSNDCNTFS